MDYAYSYGHYAIARIVDRDRELALITSETYSISTARHIRCITNAIAHYGTFHVPDVMAASKAAHKENWVSLRSNINAAVKTFRQAPRQYSLDSIHSTIRVANKYRETFELKSTPGVVKCQLPPSLDNGLAETMVAGQELVDNAQAAAKAQRYDEQRAAGERAADIRALHHKKRLFWSRLLPWIKTPENYRAGYYRTMQTASRSEKRDAVAEWRAGEGSRYGSIRGHNSTDGALLRLNGDLVETSGGVSVALLDANMLWQYIVRVKERGEDRAYPRGGKMLGHYNIRRITAGGDLTVDCHKVLWAEIDRFAIAQGWRAASLLERAGGLLRRAA